MDSDSGDGLASILSLPPLPAAEDYDSDGEIKAAASITRRLQGILVAGPPYPDELSDLCRAIAMLILRRRGLGLSHPEATATMLEGGGVVSVPAPCSVCLPASW
jgi:hypothetical protein